MGDKTLTWPTVGRHRGKLRLSLRLHRVFAVAVLLLTAPLAVAQDAAPTVERGLSDVDWDKVREDVMRLGAFGAVPASGRGAIGFSDLERTGDSTNVPVLLPKSLVRRSRLNTMAEPVRLSLKENRYSATCRTDSRSYLVQGTRIVFSNDATAAIPTTLNDDLPSALANALVDETDYGVELSFELYGVVYSVGVFCDDPTTDAACQSDGLARSLAAEMSFTP